MAFNWETFRTRTLTAAVFVAVMLIGLLWNQWSFLILFSIIHFGCWCEYLKLIEKINNINFHSYLKMGLMVMGYGLMLWFCGPSYQVNGYGLKENISLPVSAAGFALLLTGIFQKNRVVIKSFGAAVLGIIYISLCWGLMMDLFRLNINYYSKKDFSDALCFPDFTANSICWSIPILVIFSIWVNDTMAYIMGSLMGKTSLSKISPKKTWEGTIGGILLTLLVAVIVAYIADFSIKQFIITAAIIAITGTFGDLFESKLKRMAGVKDSGAIMPGHGGFLDRFDSLLLATPFVWIYVMLLLK